MLVLQTSPEHYEEIVIRCISL